MGAFLVPSHSTDGDGQIFKFMLCPQVTEAQGQRPRACPAPTVEDSIS